MNHLLTLQKLNNRYFIQRHGESQANKSGVILSHPVHGGHKKFGLTDLGRQQVIKAIRKATYLDSDILIYSSYFSRARQTAKVSQTVLGAPPLHITRRLRERYFGKWERTSNKNYHKVWAEDFQDSYHKTGGVESVQEVLNRTTILIINLEKKYHGQKILLVAHGDVLQILQCAFMKINPSGHNNLRPLEVSEIRELKLPKQ